MITSNVRGRSSPRSLLVLAASFALASLAGSSRSGSLRAQDEPAPILAKTADGAAMGDLAVWDVGGTDITFKATRGEVWVLDSFNSAGPVINTFQAANLTGPRVQIPLILPEEFTDAPVLGIAEIPHGDFKDLNFILIDPAFGSQNLPAPHVGIFKDDGQLFEAVGFIAIEGLDPTIRLSTIDVHPVREEIVAYDLASHTVVILDFTFSIVAGPVAIEGFPNEFIDQWFINSTNRAGLRGAGAGVAYNGPDAFLANSAFMNDFETHFVLEYDLANGGLYSGRAVDLSAARAGRPLLDLAFVGLDTGRVGVEDVLFCVNYGDDSLYAFRLLPEVQPPPVTLQGCVVDAMGHYSLTWSLNPTFAVDSFRIIENSVEVATVPANATTFTSPLPVLGKAFLEVATEMGGRTSKVRRVCQVRNGTRPALPGMEFDATQITNLGGELFGVAVTKTPASAGDFRAYVVGLASNALMVLDYKLEFVEQVQPLPAVLTQGSNLAAVGVAIFHLDGLDRLAILDPDGPLNNSIPSATIHSLEPGNVGVLVRTINPVDLSALEPPPFLFDWDADKESGIVGGGQLPSGDYVVVRFEFLGGNLFATKMVPIPQRSLTPFVTAPLTGIGVSILPSGNLLIAGSDTFSRTYTEALLTTPFTDEDATSVKLVGYAHGLPVSNEFFGFGPGLGPSLLTGLDTAHFPPEGNPPPPPGTPGTGVTYLPTGDIILIESDLVSLSTTGLIFVHSQNQISDPDLVAEQLAETSRSIAAGTKAGTGPLVPGFASVTEPASYFIYVFNTSLTDAAQLAVETKLGGVVLAEASHGIVVPPGRYFRRALQDRDEDQIEVDVTNSGTTLVTVKILVGAAGIGQPVVVEARFRRGDCDADGVLRITDAVVGLNWLFKGGVKPLCEDACDADDVGSVNVADMVLILNHLFRSGEAPPAPGPTDCGPDPAPSDDDFEACVYDPVVCG